MKGFWAWWLQREPRVLVFVLLANALMAIGAGWFLPPVMGSWALGGAFLLLVGWGILCARGEHHRHLKLDERYAHLFNQPDRPPSELEVRVELRRLELLERIERMQREDGR